MAAVRVQAERLVAGRQRDRDAVEHHVAARAAGGAAAVESRSEGQVLERHVVLDEPCALVDRRAALTVAPVHDRLVGGSRRARHQRLIAERCATLK